MRVGEPGYSLKNMEASLDRLDPGRHHVSAERSRGRSGRARGSPRRCVVLACKVSTASSTTFGIDVLATVHFAQQSPTVLNHQLSYSVRPWAR
jgi:hypothetical protein